VAASTKSEELGAARERKAKLVEASASCAAERATLTKGCADRRSRIRVAARKAIAEQKARRVEARETYSVRVGRAEPRSWERQYTRKESDSLAEQNVPAEFVWLWKQEKRRFDYNRTPDDRAVLFLEWMEEHREEIDLEMAQRFDVPDVRWAAMEAAYYQDQGVAAVPA
jgi:hypothetical protein